MEMWIPLENFGCPIVGCPGNKDRSEWYCAEDGTSMYISQYGNIRCNYVYYGQYAHFGQICTWQFDCGNHGNHPYRRFQHADFQGFSFALSQAVQMMNATGGNWVGALCIELGRQYGHG